MRRKIILGVWLCSLVCVRSYGQNFFYGGRISALANAGCAINDTWNIGGNPAAFTNINSFLTAVGYTNQFHSKEFSTKSIVLAMPVKSNYFGLSLLSFGTNPYIENQFSLSYGRQFGTNFTAGLKFNYHTISIENYGNSSTYSVEIGLTAKVLTDLTLATHIINPSRSDFGNELQNPLNTVFRFGARYDLSKRTFIVGELEKALEYAPSFKTAIEYGLLEKLALRGGISTNPFQQYFGLGLDLHNLEINVSSSIHPYLGYSPQMSIAYEF